MIKIRFWLHFYRLPSSFSKSLIMHKLTGTTSPVCGVTLGNDVIYACILVKILNTVTDFCLTCSHAGGKVCLLIRKWFFRWRLTCLRDSHLSFFLTSFTEKRRRPIYSKSEKKVRLWKLLASDLPWPGPCAVAECPWPMTCVCFWLQVLKHTWSINISSHGISEKRGP